MIVEPYAPVVGGLERHVQSLSRELVRRGHRLTLATTSNRSAPRFELDEGVRVHRFGGWSRALVPFYRTDRRFHPTAPDPGMVLQLARLIARERPDVVHAHSWMMYSFLPLKAWSGARLVVTLHDYGLACPKKTFIHEGSLCAGPAFAKCVRCAGENYGATRSFALTAGLRASARMHGAVDRYVAVSEGVRDALAAAGQLPGDVPVLPAFVADDTADRAARAPRPGFLPPDDGFLLFVGALGRHKGLDVLLRAWSGLSARPPLVLVGTTREDTPAKFPDGVIVALDVPNDQVLAAWSRCAIGVIPSRSEGSGIVAVEAMAAGRPVVASAVGGLPELVRDGETGLLVRAGDPVALRDALDELLADPARRARMGEAARRRAREFTLSAAVTRLERLYAEVLEEAR